MSTTARALRGAWATAAMGSLLAVAAPSLAQETGDPVVAGLRRAGQTLAQNVEKAILIRVQQTISSLPPASPQSATYTYDHRTDTWVATRRLGPNALLVPEPLAPGRIAVRASASYFDLRPLERRTNYLVETATFGPLPPPGEAPNPEFVDAVKYGVDATAQGAVFSLAGAYGLNQWSELNLSIPIVLVDAKATFVYSAVDEPGAIPFVDMFFADTPAQLDDLLDRGEIILRRRSLDEIGIGGLDGSTQVGLGRISLGGKVRFLSMGGVQAAFAPALFFPSPSESELAGPDSFDIYPRVVAAFAIADPLRAILDLGYDYDFDVAELRRFAWTVGGTYALESAAFDLALSGSVYDQAPEVFAKNVAFTAVPFGVDVFKTDVRAQAIDAKPLSSDFVDVVVGVGIRVADQVSIQGVATIPVVNVEFRAEAIGTIAVQATF